MSKRTEQFQTIRTEGALLPPDVLQQIASLTVDGVSPNSYHLPPGAKLNESIAQAWNVLQKYWKGFQEARRSLPAEKTGTELTNQHWLLPLFEELKYGRLTTVKSPEIDGRTYAIERFYAGQPIHMIGCNLPLDRRTTGARGAATASPHSMMQEYLNRSEASLWGFLSNGLVLRVLRDNVSLSRQAYVEFNLEAVMEGEVYADFALLWMLCHQSRVEAEKPDQCWLEKWSKLARERGTRVLDDLRGGVTIAIEALGRGFIAHPKNDRLRDKLRSGVLTTQDYYRQLLRIVYRLLFLFVAEDRGLLHPPEAGDEACRLYDGHYSTARLRELSQAIRGSKHGDLWHNLSLVFDALGSSEGLPQLGLPAFGSFLWRRSSTADLVGPTAKHAPLVGEPVYITNDDLLSAVRALAFVHQDRVLRDVDYRNLGSEELGSVYESLLELHPEMNIEGRSFSLSVAAGHERKTTGSYYTPDSLVQCLLDSALEPVVSECIKGMKAEEAEKAILDLKVCDPACGSGHFLIAAAHRLARHLARVRTSESEPSPEDHQHALRDIIGRCIYGVDLNPMAVELCKVSLWIEAIEPGKPLSFLDHHIQCGNSLLGATPALLAKGIPDDAFKPIEGDDKSVCSEIKKDNKRERKDYERGYRDFHFTYELGNLPAEFARLTASADDSLADAETKERRYAELVKGANYRNARLLADTWCAVFVWKKDKSDLGKLCPTERGFRNVQASPNSLLPNVRTEIERLRKQFRFFHWHLAFPDVLHLQVGDTKPENEVAGWNGGFHIVLGNPPWETLEFKEQEWFAGVRPDIADATTDLRRRLIANLESHEPVLLSKYKDALRFADAVRLLIRDTDKYPLTAKGKINTFSVFAELKRSLLNRAGRVGCIVPSGIATDDTTKLFFQRLINERTLHSLYMFENEGKLFPGIDHRNKFALLTISGEQFPTIEVDIVFGINAVAELAEEERHFTLTAEDIALINPNSRTCPIFRYRQDAEITKHIYRRVPVLIREAREGEPEENPWMVTFRQGLFNMSTDSTLFRTRQTLENDGFVLKGNTYRQGDEVYLPLYEGKMFWHFDHRFGTYEGQTEAQANQGKLPELTPEQHGDPDLFSMPRYWVVEKEVRIRVPKRPEMLALALELPEQWRKEAVIKTFCYWAAGYWRKAGDEEQATKLLSIALSASVADTQCDVLNKWLFDAQCESMQERFPLTDVDIKSMVAFPADPIPRAEELIRRFSPNWLVAFRDVTNAVVLRTAVCTVLPLVAVGHTAPLVFFGNPQAKTAFTFVACLNSFALDYAARQSIGGSHLTYSTLKQLPVLPRSLLDTACPWDGSCSLGEWLFQRAFELTFTARDQEVFARDGNDGSNVLLPFRWDESRRLLIRAELDAAFFHLYLGGDDDWKQNGEQDLLTYFPTPRHAIEYIMDTFRVLRQRDEKAHGSYQTKRVILEFYDQMTDAIRSGQPYHTWLDPPPADPRVAHPPTTRQLAYGDVVADILLLLREWNSAVSIVALEPGVLLMQNEEARRTFLGHVQTSSTAASTQGSYKVIEGIDLVYQGLVISGAIVPVGQNGYRLLKPELVADLSAENRQRAKEVVEAIKRLDRPEDALAIVAELTHERYAVAAS